MGYRQEDTGEEWNKCVHDYESWLALKQSAVYASNHFENPIYRVSEKEKGCHFHAFVVLVDTS